MNNIVCCIIFGFFIILGMVDTIKFFIIYMFGSQKITDKNSYFSETASDVKLTCDNAEYTIRKMLIQGAFIGSHCAKKIILPDSKDETYQILSILCKDYPCYLEAKNHVLFTKI